MSREKLVPVPVRLSGEVLERIDEVAGAGKRAEFIRKAVMAALEGGVFGLGAETVKAGLALGDQLEPIGVSRGVELGVDSEHRDEAGADRERKAKAVQRAPVSRSVLAPVAEKRKQTIDDVPDRWRDGARRFLMVLGERSRTLPAVAVAAEMTEGLARRIEAELLMRGLIADRCGVLSVSDGASGQ